MQEIPRHQFVHNVILQRSCPQYSRGRVVPSDCQHRTDHRGFARACTPTLSILVARVADLILGRQLSHRAQLMGVAVYCARALRVID